MPFGVGIYSFKIEGYPQYLGSVDEVNCSRFLLSKYQNVKTN